ncbi:hypothetical protein KIN20_003355 [Parelaphostrongylus tenuis]|nr:hypothetical protein KIN20_003355 [Parelaphostrongylus tenuis]
MGELIGKETTRQTLLGDVRMCMDKSFRPVDCPESQFLHHPSYISKHSSPLPSFKECPSMVIYLSDTPSSLHAVPVMKSREIVFWINPLMIIYTANSEKGGEFVLG